MRSDIWRGKHILITGGGGFVGRRVVDRLVSTRHVPRDAIRTDHSSLCDLREFSHVQQVMERIDIVIHLAADVGGIDYSRSHPATQFRNCSLIDLHVFEAASQMKVSKFVAVSSSVAYPAGAPSPLSEECFFDGPPAPTAYGYSYAKRATAILARAYAQEHGLPAVVVVPNNAYGPGQEIDLSKGHVIPSLILKCLTCDTLEVWGDGSQVRDFLYVDDLAEGILLAAERLQTPEPVNLGTGKGTSIQQLVSLIVTLCGFTGKVLFDVTKPKGQPKRIVDIARAKQLLDFKPCWTLHEGLKDTVAWVREQIA